MSPRDATNRHGKKRRTRIAAGKLRHEPIDYRSLAAAQPHRKSLPEGFRLDERAGTHLGRLNLIWRIHARRTANKRVVAKPSIGITDIQYQAGQRYAIIVGSYLAMAGAPRGIAGSGRGRGCAGEEDCPPETCACRILGERYFYACQAIEKAAGRPAWRVVQSVVVHDEPCSAQKLIDLKSGLTALANHFGLTREGKSLE